MSEIWKSTTPRAALIDGDVVIYANACKTESEGGTITDCIATCIEKIKMRAEKVGVHDSEGVKIALTGSNNYRKALHPTYKAKRPEKPRYWLDTRNAIIDYYGDNVLLHEELEADDMMGIYATSNKNCIICTIDKDLKQIPGWHYSWEYSWGKGSYPGDDFPHEVSEADANKWLFVQLLAGDSTDGVRGIPGIGHKKAVDEIELLDIGIKSTKSAIYNAGGYYNMTKNFDNWYSTLQQIFIWRKQMPHELVESGPLIKEIVDSIPGIEVV